MDTQGTGNLGRVIGGRGFTLIELLVVVAVISILASITMPVVLQAMREGQKATCQNNHKQLHHAATLYSGAFTQLLPPFGYYYTPSGGSSPYQSPWWTESLVNYMNASHVHDTREGSVIRCPSWAKEGSSRHRGITCNFGDIFRYYTPSSLSSTVFHGPGSIQMTAITKPSNAYLMMDGGQSFAYSASCWPRVDDWDGDGIVDTRTGTGCIYGGGDPFRHGKACNVLFADGHLRTVRFREWLAETTAWDPYQ